MMAGFPEIGSHDRSERRWRDRAESKEVEAHTRIFEGILIAEGRQVVAPGGALQG